MTRIITLLTDFGTADGYVGEMKGVLCSAAPDAALVDITHDLAAQDVRSAERASVAKVEKLAAAAQSQGKHGKKRPRR